MGEKRQGDRNGVAVGVRIEVTTPTVHLDLRLRFNTRGCGVEIDGDLACYRAVAEEYDLDSEIVSGRGGC